jgi:hypothetical protein
MAKPHVDSIVSRAAQVRPVNTEGFIKLGGMALLVLLLAWLCTAPAWAAEEVARVFFSDGVVTAQSPQQAVRVVAKSSVLLEGDVITTTERSFAVLEFGDGARMTLRPNTTFAIARYNLTDKPQSQNIILQLFKGGLRTVTGWVGKRDPHSVQVITPTATIGIRGTSFDARLCQGDCQGERYKTQGAPEAAAPPVLGRVQTVWGKGHIDGADHKARTLAEGVALYQGDVVQTQERSATTLVFVDQTRVTLNAGSRFEVTSYHFAKMQQPAKEEANAKQAAGQSDNAVFRLLRGSLRVATGLIGKVNPEQVKVRVSTSTIGVRGTGFDLHCTDACAAVDYTLPVVPSAQTSASGNACGPNATAVEPPAPGTGLFASTWDGIISVTTGQCQVQLTKGESVFVNPRTGQTTPLSRTPDFMDEGLAPRPDQMQVNYEGYFGFMPLEDSGYGLYTYVREGGIHMTAGERSVDISPGQSGYAKEGSNVVGRLSQTPAFMVNDPYPLPESASESSQSVIDLMSENILRASGGSLAQCSIR